MNVAFVAWGSLIWRPGNLRIKTAWRRDGPLLPIEFARISQDQRLTLVIHPGSQDQRAYWAVSEFISLEKARQNIRKRENAKLSDIHYLADNGNASRGATPQVIERLKAWLEGRDDIQAVVWTGLSSNWKEKRGRNFTVDDAVAYLRELEIDKTQETIFKLAQEYVRNTPSNIQTKVREKMRALGWKDLELPAILFES